MPAFNKILLHKNLANFPSSVFSKCTFNCKVIDGNMTINVSCLPPFICVTFKTTLRRNSQEGRFCHRTVLFPVIRRYCSADVKMLVFLSPLPYKNRRRRRQNMSLIIIRQVVNTRAHENIYSPDLFISQAAQALSMNHTSDTTWHRIIRVYMGFSTRYPWR